MPTRITAFCPDGMAASGLNSGGCAGPFPVPARKRFSTAATLLAWKCASGRTSLCWTRAAVCGGWAWRWSRNSRTDPMQLNLLITHTHWDHIQGFPFFLPAYNPKNNVTIYGYEGARQGLQSTLSSQMESPYFPISMQQMPGHIAIHELREMKFNINQVPVRAHFSQPSRHLHRLPPPDPRRLHCLSAGHRITPAPAPPPEPRDQRRPARKKENRAAGRPRPHRIHPRCRCPDS